MRSRRPTVLVPPDHHQPTTPHSEASLPSHAGSTIAISSRVPVWQSSIQLNARAHSPPPLFGRSPVLDAIRRVRSLARRTSSVRGLEPPTTRRRKGTVVHAILTALQGLHPGDACQTRELK
jgi:hypothetical protein